MTQLVDRPNTALLVIDVQNDVVAAAQDRDVVIANINSVVSKARAAGAPVIWVQHDDDDLPSGSDEWLIVDELDPQPDEAVVQKNFRDSFQATTLEHVLAERGVGKLVVTGAQTDYCVRWTLHGALARGYDTVLVSDAHTTDAMSATGMPSGAQLIEHTNATWASQTSHNSSADVLAANQISF